MTNIVKFIIAALVISGGVGNAAAQTGPTPQGNLHQDLLSQARAQSRKGLYPEAAATCKYANSLFHDGTVPAQFLLGEVYIHQERYDDALKEIARVWRPGKSIHQDLLAAIAFILSNSQKGSLGFGILGTVANRKGEIEGRVGEVDLLPLGKERSARGALALLLYAASPELSPEETLDFCRKADALVPNNPVASYLMGNAYFKLKQFDKAKPRLDFAVQHSNGRLLGWANQVSLKNELALKAKS